MSLQKLTPIRGRKPDIVLFIGDWKSASLQKLTPIRGRKLNEKSIM